MLYGALHSVTFAYKSAEFLNSAAAQLNRITHEYVYISVCLSICYPAGLLDIIEHLIYFSL